MVVLCQSQTWPINPPGAEPVLSLEQVWEVLEIKCRKPELFIKPIASATVLEETQTTIKREAFFREVRSHPHWGNHLTMHPQGMGPPGGSMIEDIVLQKPWKVPLPSSSLPQTHSTSFSYLTQFPQFFRPISEAPAPVALSSATSSLKAVMPPIST